ncbi:MAG: hypothetical protein QOE60_2132, partial [Thermoleophilaceae bacterium]|nr:hypothetical protein [Thermoleophilaceae bacterium]
MFKARERMRAYRAGRGGGVGSDGLPLPSP